jgi:8-oxo-dGTP pyrophosphatase MutT (NUDIX family)
MSRPITSAPLPDWFRPLAEAAATVKVERISRHRPPATGGRPSAVLVLFGSDAPSWNPDGGLGSGGLGGEGLGPETVPGPDVLILQRASTLRSHAGQPAFPGGAADPDDDGPVGTALREAAEEVGLDPASVEVVATLPELWIPPSGFVVTPVLGWWREPHPVMAADLAEVASVVRVPVSELIDPACRLRVRHPSGHLGPAFEVRGMLVWGFTAGILSTLLELAGWAVPWDESRTVGLSEEATKLVASTRAADAPGVEKSR